MKKYIIIAAIFASLGACKKDIVNKYESQTPTLNNDITDINKMIVPAGFTFKSTAEVHLSVKLRTNDDKPLKGLRVNFMDKSPEEGGKILAVGVTDASGNLEMTQELPTAVTELILNTNYIGLPNNLVAPIQGGKIIAQIGGSVPQKMITADTRLAKYQTMMPSYGKAGLRYSYKLGTFTTGSNGGVPNFLVTPRDVISQTMLNNINVSLPEGRPVPNYHSEYLSNSAERNIVLKELCDVWATFVSEGAGYKNSVFYFLYNKNNKPTNISQIDSFYSMFPNASFANSGGGLTSGDKIYLGRWGADTCIGFAIASNGWTGTAPGAGAFFYTSIKSMNPESNDANKEHTVLLYDNSSEKMMIAFEDLNREQGSDNDFNDVVMYATANPVKAVDVTNVIPLTIAKDSDSDGVDDSQDDYPNDDQRAYTSYYPSATTFGSIAFEDQWPSKGDYDLNDVVVDYQYKVIKNASNNVKDIIGKYKLRAAGGIYHNAFAVQFPFNTSAVASVTGTSQGLEAGNTKAVLTVLDDAKSLISTYNTMPGKGYVETDTIVANITLTTPSNITIGAFNPFIYVNEAGKGRGYEVHLSGQQPTQKADASVLGTNADVTNPGAGVYYKTATGLPFAISIPESFAYPIEKADIVTAHLKFAAWAQSGGSSYTDWYKNNSGYRNNANIYVKP